MDNGHYRDQFEQLLKDTADSFRMYPSEKVWHSLYNNLHPGKKWPSFAVLLLLIASIMYIGVSNQEAPKSNKIATSLSANSKEAFRSTFNSTKTTELKKALGVHQLAYLNKKVNDADAEYYFNRHSDGSAVLQEKGNAIITITPSTPTEIDNIPDGYPNNVTVVTEKTITAAFAENTNAENTNAKKEADSTKQIINLENKTHTLNTNKSEKKKGSKILFQFYITPSYGFRKMSERKSATDNNNSLMAVNSNANEYALNHSGAFNMEAGAAVINNLSASLRLRAGLQLNYTNYYIHAYQLNRPVLTQMLIVNQTGAQTVLMQPKTSYISNAQSLANKQFSSNTYQLSLPIGLDYKIAGKNKFKWYTGFTLQPTYITSGMAYLLSADHKNYINDDSKLRMFNFNGAVETFISYEIKPGIQIQAGPQLRYQFLSTYANEYSYKENLYNTGIRIGVTSKF